VNASLRPNAAGPQPHTTPDEMILTFWTMLGQEQAH